MTKRLIALAGAAVLALGVGCNSPQGSPNGMRGSDRNEGSAEQGQTSRQGNEADRKGPTSPDNTANNKRDQSGDTLTPMDQKEDPADLSTTASIRREILKTQGLSSTADNVKVITADGKVTLRGVVKDKNEKDQIQKIAERVAGAGKVDNQLEIDTNQM